jgi:hypothetical protein
MNFDNILVILFVIGIVIVAIGLFPYLAKLLKGMYALIDSVSDFFHYSFNKHINSKMTKNINPKEIKIDPKEIEIDRNELVVNIPQDALENQLKVIEVNQMYVDMMKDLNRKRPVTIWGQERLIDKLRNQNIRLELTIDQFGLHNTMIKEAAKLEATMRHAPKLVEHELEMILLDEKIEKEMKIHSFLDAIHEIDSHSKVRDIDIKIKESEHDRYLIETKLSELERKANINMVLAKTDQEKARASLMMASLDLFMTNKLSEKLQAYLIVSVFNPSDQSFDEELQKILRDDKRYDADKKKWEAKSTKEDYKHKKEKLIRQRRQQKDNDKEVNE